MHQKPKKMSSRLLAVGAIASAAAVVICAASDAHAAFATTEFSENATLVNHQPLAGTDAFAAQGLHFTGSAEFVVDNRLIGAGLDDKGITTGPSSPIMGVTFDTPATGVSFDAVSVNTDFFATAFDANNNILDTFHADPAGTDYITHTFSGVGNIAKIEFHDNNNFIAVGRLSAVPEPASIGLTVIGLGGLAAGRRRR